MTQEVKRGYKVCHPSPEAKETGLYYSAFSLGKLVSYYIGQWAKRPEKCGPLAVFDELMWAFRFKTNHSTEKLVVLNCEYKPSEEKTLYCNDYYIYFGDKMIFKEMFPQDFPKGTVLADEVKIIKEIKEKDVRF